MSSRQLRGAALRCLLLLLWLMPPSVSHAQVAAMAVCSGERNAISLPSGTSIRVLPSDSIGKQYSSPVTSTSLVIANCTLDVGSEDAAQEMVDEGRAITLVLELVSGSYARIDSAEGVVISIPEITENAGIGLRLLTANNVPLDPTQTQWPIAEPVEVDYRFDGSKVEFAAAVNQQLSYQLVKVAPARVPGNRSMGQQRGIFRVNWVLDYGQATARVVHSTPIDMSLGAPVSLQIQGCSVQDVRQILPAIRRASFTGEGSTYSETAFTLPFTCFGGPSVSIGIAPRYPSTAPGVGLADALGTMGVGVQLLSSANGVNTPWDFSSQPKLDALVPAEGDPGGIQRWPVRMLARYYQIANSVKTGSLNVLYTVTIHYD